MKMTTMKGPLSWSCLRIGLNLIRYHQMKVSVPSDVENPGISYSDILILIPDSRAVYDPIFTLFILPTLSR